MSKIKFTKTCAAGNDFIMIDNRKGVVPSDPAGLRKFIHKICVRHFSIGADGVILLESSTRKDCDFKMRYFNADGGEVEMCGNGARSISKFAQDLGIIKDKAAFETMAGRMEAEIAKDKKKIRMTDPKDMNLEFSLGVKKENFVANFINTGVPHVVIFVDELADIDIRRLGWDIRFHKKFAPAGTNVNFVKVIDDRDLEMRTYERGVEGETLACGTGAVASSLVSYALGKVKDVPVNVQTPGGVLKVYFETNGEGEKSFRNVFLEGDAEVTFEGEVEL